MIRVKQTSGHRVSMSAQSAQGWRERPVEERYEPVARGERPHLAAQGFIARTAEGVLYRETCKPPVVYKRHRVVKGRTLTHEDVYGSR